MAPPKAQGGKRVHFSPKNTPYPSKGTAEQPVTASSASHIPMERMDTRGGGTDSEGTKGASSTPSRPIPIPEAREPPQPRTSLGPDPLAPPLEAIAHSMPIDIPAPKRRINPLPPQDRSTAASGFYRLPPPLTRWSLALPQLAAPLPPVLQSQSVAATIPQGTRAREGLTAIGDQARASAQIPDGGLTSTMEQPPENDEAPSQDEKLPDAEELPHEEGLPEEGDLSEDEKLPEDDNLHADPPSPYDDMPDTPMPNVYKPSSYRYSPDHPLKHTSEYIVRETSVAVKEHSWGRRKRAANSDSDVEHEAEQAQKTQQPELEERPRQASKKLRTRSTDDVDIDAPQEVEPNDGAQEPQPKERRRVAQKQPRTRSTEGSSPAPSSKHSREFKDRLRHWLDVGYQMKFLTFNGVMLSQRDLAAYQARKAQLDAQSRSSQRMPSRQPTPSRGSPQRPVSPSPRRSASQNSVIQKPIAFHTWTIEANDTRITARFHSLTDDGIVVLEEPNHIIVRYPVVYLGWDDRRYVEKLVDLPAGTLAWSGEEPPDEASGRSSQSEDPLSGMENFQWPETGQSSRPLANREPREDEVQVPAETKGIEDKLARMQEKAKANLEKHKARAFRQGYIEGWQDAMKEIHQHSGSRLRRASWALAPGDDDGGDTDRDSNGTDDRRDSGQDSYGTSGRGAGSGSADDTEGPRGRPFEREPRFKSPKGKGKGRATSPKGRGKATDGGDWQKLFSSTGISDTDFADEPFGGASHVSSQHFASESMARSTFGNLIDDDGGEDAPCPDSFVYHSPTRVRDASAEEPRFPLEVCRADICLLELGIDQMMLQVFPVRDIEYDDRSIQEAFQSSWSAPTATVVFDDDDVLAERERKKFRTKHIRELGSWRTEESGASRHTNNSLDYEPMPALRESRRDEGSRGQRDTRGRGNSQDRKSHVQDRERSLSREGANARGRQRGEYHGTRDNKDYHGNGDSDASMTSRDRRRRSPPRNASLAGGNQGERTSKEPELQSETRKDTVPDADSRAAVAKHAEEIASVSSHTLSAGSPPRATSLEVGDQAQRPNEQLDSQPGTRIDGSLDIGSRATSVEAVDQGERPSEQRDSRSEARVDSSVDADSRAAFSESAQETVSVMSHALNGDSLSETSRAYDRTSDQEGEWDSELETRIQTNRRLPRRTSTTMANPDEDPPYRQARGGRCRCSQALLQFCDKAEYFVQPLGVLASHYLTVTQNWECDREIKRIVRGMAHDCNIMFARLRARALWASFDENEALAERLKRLASRQYMSNRLRRKGSKRGLSL